MVTCERLFETPLWEILPPGPTFKFTIMGHWQPAGQGQGQGQRRVPGPVPVTRPWAGGQGGGAGPGLAVGAPAQAAVVVEDGTVAAHRQAFEMLLSHPEASR